MAVASKFFRFQSIKKQRILQYIAYALGEIILIVAGILIALHINNRNEEKKQALELNGILNTISYDLEQDTLVLGYSIQYYETREALANDIVSGAMSDADIENCILCNSLISTYMPFSVNDKGYLQLKNYHNNTFERDSLSTDIVQFYGAYVPLLEDFQDQVKDFTLENIAEWRDHKPWFASIMSNQLDPRYTEYLKTQEFRNKVAYFNIIACKNYLNFLRQYKLNATEVLKRLDARKKIIAERS